ncbi:hypothetical protein V6N13_046329 [Hibiscus sabdariffa]
MIKFKEIVEKEEAESSKVNHQTNANPPDGASKQINSRQQSDANKKVTKPVEPVEDKLESILRMKVTQLCQEVDDDANSDDIIENTEEEVLEEVIYAQQNHWG